MLPEPDFPLPREILNHWGILPITRAYNDAFPGRIRAVYVDGSVADGTALATSDLDLTVVFKDAIRAEERDAIERLRVESGTPAMVELDVGLVDEAQLGEQGMRPALKLASALVWGEDVRDQFEIISIARWTRDRMHAAYWLTNQLYHRPVPVRLPLDFPNADDEFFGYLRRPVRLPDGRLAPSARDLIRSTGWAATALLALRQGVYVARKRDCHVLYRQRIGDEWSDLLADIYDYCRGRWTYLIPEDAADRDRLRSICERTLAFENHFLTEYLRFLLDELRDTDANRRAQALTVQEKLPLEDARVAAAIARP